MVSLKVLSPKRVQSARWTESPRESAEREALEEAGITPSVVAGTSIGAVVGGCYVANGLAHLRHFALGLTRRKVVLGYALRNALLPVITTLGMVFSFALGANVLVEKVFAWPGIGSYAVDALVASDYAAVQGFVLAMALLFVALNLIIDLLYAVIDPRIGFGAT